MRRLLLVLSVLFLFSTILFAGKNLAEYPLQIQVLESHWNRPVNPVDRRFGGVDGWGRGNIKDGDSIRGFDFSYSSTEPFHRTVGNAHYVAKWKKDGVKMELLVGEIGSPDKFHTYDLKTTVLEDVYVRSPEGPTPISQAEYKAREAAKEDKKEAAAEDKKEDEK